jgi:hypothetical protein
MLQANSTDRLEAIDDNLLDFDRIEQKSDFWVSDEVREVGLLFNRLIVP